MPPLSRIARLQITAIVVLGLVVSVVAGIWLVHVNRVVGVGVYTVTAHLPDSGGIFTNAEVTYLGIPVGRVGPLHLTRDGVDVELQLDSGAAKVPASAMAVVANRSAIGEQFIDLQRPAAMTMRTSTTGPRSRGPRCHHPSMRWWPPPCDSRNRYHSTTCTP